VSRWLTRRAGVTATAAIALLAVIVLAAAGSRSIAVRTFALGAPNSGQVTILHPGSQVCEGPVAGAETSNGTGIWGGAIGAPATMTITARDAHSGETLASGPLRAIAEENEWTARLDHEIAPNRAVRICLHEDAGTFTLSGSPAIRSDVVMSGKPAGQEFSLVLLNDHRHSLLSWLPTAFSRASLWRPSWVGSWTFWLLLAGVAAAFGLGVVAVAGAAGADDGPDAPRTDHLNGDDPTPSGNAPDSDRPAATTAR
jgi:hypothetical protein